MDWLRQFLTDARWDSSGKFQVHEPGWAARYAAIQKKMPGYFVLKLLQAAVALQSSRIEVRLGNGEVSLQAQAPTLSNERAQNYLRTARLAASTLKDYQFELSLCDSGWQARARILPKRGWRVWPARLGLDVESCLQARAWLCPIPLFVNGHRYNCSAVDRVAGIPRLRRHRLPGVEPELDCLAQWVDLVKPTDQPLAVPPLQLHRVRILQCGDGEFERHSIAHPHTALGRVASETGGPLHLEAHHLPFSSLDYRPHLAARRVLYLFLERGPGRLTVVQDGVILNSLDESETGLGWHALVSHSQAACDAEELTPRQDEWWKAEVARCLNLRSEILRRLSNWLSRSDCRDLLGLEPEFLRQCLQH